MIFYVEKSIFCTHCDKLSRRYWFYGSKINNFFISGSLSIKDSQETDQGDYECVAENSKGTEYSYEAKLYVRGKGLQLRYDVTCY